MVEFDGFTVINVKMYSVLVDYSGNVVFQNHMYAVIHYLMTEVMTLSDESSKFIEVISNFHRFRHPSSLGSAFKSWIKLHSIKAATTFNNVGKLVVYTLLLMKWNGSCSVQIYAKVGNFFFNLKICHILDGILLHS